MPHRVADRKSSRRPHLGLVCLSYSDECRFRAISRTRYLALRPRERERQLRAIYWDNFMRLHWAIGFCARRAIRLYRCTSGLFPMSDEAIGNRLLEAMSANLASVGRRLERLDMRMVMHPDQFVVLNSENPKVVRNSVLILAKQAKWFDLMGLPRSPWAAIIIHGGKSGRGDALVETIRALPESVRSRLCLENDEYAYSAEEILDICRHAGVPMIFDNLHHAVREKLCDYQHTSFARMTRAARDTWPNPLWQIVHLSNGNTHFCDRNHSERIAAFPSAYRAVPWIEVESRGKETAIEHLRSMHPFA